MATVTLKFQNSLNCYIWFTSTSYQRWLNLLKTQAIFYHLSSFSNQACSACLTQIARKACYNSHTYCDIWHATKKQKVWRVKFTKTKASVSVVVFQFNMRISVIFGTLSVSYKPVVSVLSPLASNSCGGSHMVTNIPAPDHLDELLGHCSFFFKDQRKNDVSNFESDTMTSFRTTSASHWRANTYSILSYDRTNFLNMMHLHFDFTFNGKPL